MDILIGYTGFVGQNLNKQHQFDAIFNSKNITAAYGLKPDLCVYSGVRAEKFRADSFPDEDLAHIKNALENIQRIKPKKLVLISTVDVIPMGQATDVYEDTHYSTDKLTPYGKNRLFLEQEVRRLYPDALIMRLPALFGYGLKKNFIFDIINYVPAMLKKAKFDDLVSKQQQLTEFYSVDENEFYRLKPNITREDKARLQDMFKRLEFSALNFTDSRSRFAFYHLDYLWSHIQILLNAEVKLAHMACTPVSAAEVYQEIYGADFSNEILSQPFDYTFFKTRFAQLLGGNSDYIFSKSAIINQIASFVRSMENKNV